MNTFVCGSVALWTEPSTCQRGDRHWYRLGIAQRDSANSLSLAATSTKLAATSHEVAISTSRDSAVMRVIAAITVFFLPATFTATLFSTSFFDFHGGRNDPIYSWWLWLYFLVASILTAITVAGTWWLWKNKEKEIAAQFKEAKDK
ncbi:hypothetical protein BCR34DRAFT_207116 [Clohesyomyces aquaticus]|uniref:Uncharacterized protein n=1 Tax=Clohesyomyces aquaticus TaxID=1231657 RepID=A0A1Y2A9J7_9PLEO|nr:hypothetical protein BCR34DRAFT_207116 [Clohesyomyces aquaticus]